MTEKRFTCETKTQGCVSIDLMKDNGQIIEKFEAINLLNELDSENQKLKNENEKLKNTIGNYADITACSIQILDENQEMKDDYASVLSKKMFNLVNENEQLKQFKENVIKWVDSQMKFNVKRYIETEDYHFKSENVDLHNFKVFIGID